MSAPSQIVTISNDTASVSVDLRGGAIIDFHLHEGGVNPLTFKREESNFQGHFICLGRWGPPSDGEAAAGIVMHGEAVNSLWEGGVLHFPDFPMANNLSINISVTSPLEGLQISRMMGLDPESAVLRVSETISNINPLSRLFNIIQHPTIAAPFLTGNTIINCNADKGFNYKLSTKPLKYASKWPYGVTEGFEKMNVSVPDKPYSSVFSFIIKKGFKHGWITAYSPESDLIIGYLWEREIYPWINLWQDFDENGKIQARGLEFGTTGMHKPYGEIIREGNHRVFGEDSYRYIDAGGAKFTHYTSFMCKVPEGFTSVGAVKTASGRIIIEEEGTKKQIIIKTSFTF